MCPRLHRKEVAQLGFELPNLGSYQLHFLLLVIREDCTQIRVGSVLGKESFLIFCFQRKSNLLPHEVLGPFTHIHVNLLEKPAEFSSSSFIAELGCSFFFSSAGLQHLPDVMGMRGDCRRGSTFSAMGYHPLVWSLSWTPTGIKKWPTSHSLDMKDPAIIMGLSRERSAVYLH